MKKNLIVLSFFLCLSPLVLFAQSIPPSTIHIGLGKNIVLNQIKHGNLYSEGGFDIAKPKIGDHFSLQWKKHLKNKCFIISGIEVDFSKYAYSTLVVPDSSFATTKFSFEHKYATIDIPIGVGKNMKLFKKQFHLSGGLGLGLYFNRRQEIRGDIFLINYKNEALGWDNDINVKSFFKFNASAWFRAQYKVLNYNCNPNKGGVWLEIMAKQNLMYNSDVTSYAAFFFPNRPSPNKFYIINEFKNRPLFFSFSVLFDLK